MHIFTAKGWMPLNRPTENTLTEAPPRYHGPLPSFEVVRYISSLEAAHADWVKRRKAAEPKAA